MFICYVPCSLNQLAQLVTMLSVLLSDKQCIFIGCQNCSLQSQTGTSWILSKHTGQARPSPLQGQVHWVQHRHPLKELCFTESFIPTKAWYSVTRSKIWQRKKNTEDWSMSQHKPVQPTTLQKGTVVSDVPDLWQWLTIPAWTSEVLGCLS